jgi:hypothetical protein
LRPRKGKAVVLVKRRGNEGVETRRGKGEEGEMGGGKVFADVRDQLRRKTGESGHSFEVRVGSRAVRYVEDVEAI